jgi:hypothetical protein
MEIRIQVGKILPDLPEIIEKRMLHLGLDALDESKRLCPVDTGRLKNSLKVKTEKVNQNIIETTLSTDVKYAPYVEFGTGLRGNYPYDIGVDLIYGSTPGQVAQPYLYPAVIKALGGMEYVLA